MQVITPRQSDAVEVEDFRRATGFIEPDDDQDVLIQRYLTAAQDIVERGTNRPVMPRTVRITEILPAGAARFWLPCAPALSIGAVSIDDGSGEVAAEDWRLARGHDEPVLVLGAALAGEAVLTVEAVVGHSADNAPPQLREAMILIAKDWAEANIAVDQRDMPKVQFGARAIMNQVRYRRPQVFA